MDISFLPLLREMETDRTTRAAINTRGCLEFLQGTKGHPGNALAFNGRHTLGQPLLRIISSNCAALAGFLLGIVLSPVFVLLG